MSNVVPLLRSAPAPDPHAEFRTLRKLMLASFAVLDIGELEATLIADETARVMREIGRWGDGG